jgi:thioesterase domain-containing protein
MPTIERHAHLLRGSTSGSVSCLVPIRPGGDAPPFFLAHPWGGEVLLYRSLAAKLPPGRPVFGLRRDRYKDERPRYTRVEDMAAQYVSAIRSVQPAGPYHLGGLSFGAVIAFEMACLLRAAGEEVASLILLDPATPGGGKEGTEQGLRPGRARIRALIQRARYHAAALRILGRSERTAYLRNVIRRAFDPSAPSPASSLDAPSVLGRLPAEIRHHVDPFAPRPYPGGATLVLAHLQPHGRNRCGYWRPLLAGGMEVRIVPGLHGLVVEDPFVRVLAPEVAACLSAADTRR